MEALFGPGFFGGLTIGVVMLVATLGWKKFTASRATAKAENTRKDQ